jgi:hypothetical protein
MWSWLRSPPSDFPQIFAAAARRTGRPNLHPHERTSDKALWSSVPFGNTHRAQALLAALMGEYANAVVEHKARAHRGPMVRVPTQGRQTPVLADDEQAPRDFTSIMINLAQVRHRRSLAAEGTRGAGPGPEMAVDHGLRDPARSVPHDWKRRRDTQSRRPSVLGSPIAAWTPCGPRLDLSLVRLISRPSVRIADWSWDWWPGRLPIWPPPTR